ncbi:MAG: hypothetical protein AAFR96_11850 [Planctomycetota bacterium]
MNGPNRSVSITLLALAGIVSLALVATGVLRERQGGAGEPAVHAGALGLIITTAAAAVVISLPGGGAREQSSEADSGTLRAMRDVQKAVERLSQQGALSDDARRVLNRSKERELLCRAIEEDVRRHDWEAALVLCRELAERFGYEQEADRFRSQIDMLRAESLDEEIAGTIAKIDALIVERRWDDAAAAAAHAEQSFPATQSIRTVVNRVARSKEAYKSDLERRFLMMAQAERVDEAMDLLRELDAYLTEREAEPLQEVARGVIGKARENLGAAFKLAYQDREWGIAVSLGEQIVSQFPNSRMAEEVSGVLAELRDRAAQA